MSTDNGQTSYCEMKDQWVDVQSYFSNALLDISEISKGETRSTLEDWFDILKKVMKMYESSDKTIS